MMLLVVYGLLALSCSTYATSEAEDCANGLTACTHDLMQTAQQAEPSQEKACQALRTFLACVFATKCASNKGMQQKVIESTKSSLQNQGIECDVDVEEPKAEQTGEEENGGSGQKIKDDDSKAGNSAVKSQWEATFTIIFATAGLAFTYRNMF